MQSLASIEQTESLWSVEPGSFRDRNGRVFYHGGRVLRGLSAEALESWQALSATRFFRRFTDEGMLVPTEQVDGALAPPAADGKAWAGVLQHATIPFVSYPYEWSFGMLKDAALLQLQLLQAALDEGMILKDSSAFNFQWRGVQPMFIDIPSFERLVPGEPWVGYRQFCEMFLYPLFLQAYRDVAFQPWLRGSLDGITPDSCWRLLSARDLARPGVLTHVYLQAALQARYAKTERNVKSDLRAAGFNVELIRANVRRLTRLVQRLTWKRGQSHWSDYGQQHSYSEADHSAKAAFVRDVVHSQRWRLVWDLGSNIGTFARIAAENADYVVAMDVDHLVVDRLYAELKGENSRLILPLVMNVADPSPALGWRCRERKTVAERGRPELTLCLALIHHVVLSANIPLREFISWLASLGTALVIEFVSRDDPKVQTLLRNKRDQYGDYDLAHFEQCLGEAFTVARRQPLASGTRTLYHALP